MKFTKRIICLLTASLMTILCGCSNQSSDADKITALIPKPIAANAVEQNPYMAVGDNSVHNDTYSSDVTDAVMPIGIGSQISASLETQNVQAPPAAFYDENNNAITPFLGGVAIAEMDGDVIQRKDVFVPSQHDEEQYVVQISYSFVDSNNNIVLPTSHGHVIVLQTMDENGDILPVFKKIMDVNVSGYAKQTLGDDIDTNLLSIVYDYSGNLWFVTGGFRIYPDRNPAGFLGYISRDYIEKSMSGETVGQNEGIFLHKLSDGEAAENGISSNKDGAVILTNMACYMLNADNGVNIKWRTEYESNGTNDAEADSDYTGGGLAYGSGTTPTLTNELVLFTDNLDPVNLIALSSDTGELVAKSPVLDGLGEDFPVSVENSILVYSADEATTSVIVCNWFGAGNAGLSDPDADSSVQTYDNIYDKNWIEYGNKYIAPGVERVDIVKENGSYSAKKVWFRDDISDTSMIKLSTATGYLYGYWQNMQTNMWCYEVLDFATGETVWEVPISDLPQYNNMAVGMIADVKGNTVYCPTNNMEMVILQDNFVYLPDSPIKKIALSDMERYRLTDAEFSEQSNTQLSPSTYLMYAQINNISVETTIAFKTNGLDKKVSEYSLFCKNSNDKLMQYSASWEIYDSTGNKMGDNAVLKADEIYEIRFDFKDGAEYDLDATEKNVKLSAILAS